MLFLFFLIINLTAFMLFGADKFRSRHKMFRTPESTLLSVCYLGGGIGGYLGMLIFRHKTNKKMFAKFVPFSIFVSLFEMLMLLYVRGWFDL